ncbi:MAG: hypothetical protein C0423_03345 [Methylibium sp.]|nr:hypothetical protein [Methylibium sp.]
MEEIEYLRDGNTLVTSTRIEINGQTYAVRNVGSVKVETNGKPWFAVLLALVGAMMAAGGDPTLVPGLLLLAGSGAWIWQKVRMRTLIIVSGGGETTALKSTNSGQVEAVRAAIAKAISAR